MANLRDLARDFRAAQRDLRMAAVRTNRRVGDILIAEAKKRSSGTFKTETLAQAPPGLNHPYGIGPHNARGDRGSLPYGDESMVNRQSSLFYRSWRLRAASAIGLPGVPCLVLSNDAPYAKFLETGTDDSIARPIDVRLRKLLAEVAPRIAQEEFARAWRVRFDTK